jgi:chaperonin GroES
LPSPKIKPLSNNLFVTRIEVKDKTAGGLYIPDAAKTKGERAKVLAVGPGKYTDSGTKLPMSCCVGNIVLLGKYAGTEVDVNGEKAVIVSEDEVLALELE